MRRVPLPLAAAPAWLLAAVPAGLAAASASAQSLPPVQQAITQGAQIEQSVTRSTVTQPVRNGTGADESIAGEAGIYVLRRQDILFVAAQSSLGYSSNPERSFDRFGGSGLIETSLTAGLRTRLGGVVDLSVAGNFDGTYYFRRTAPSNSAASGTVTVGGTIPGTRLYLGATGFGGGNFGRGFRAPVAFWGGSGFVTAPVPIGRTVLLQPTLAGTRQWTGIRENDNTSASARLAATWVRRRASVTLSGAVSRVWFDNFYEDVTFVPRRDWQYEAGATAAFQVSPRLLVSASVRYTKRTSTFFLASFNSIDGSASATVTRRF